MKMAPLRGALAFASQLSVCVCVCVYFNVFPRSVLCGKASYLMRLFSYPPSPGAKFEADMEQMRSDLAVSPPLPGAYTPRKNQMCVAKFVDGLW